MDPSKINVFFLGATGYLGSQVLIFLAQVSELRDKLHITALCRNSEKRLPELRKIHPDLDVIEGTLSSDDIIQEQASRVDVVINTANCDHLESVQCLSSSLPWVALETDNVSL